MSYEMFRRVVDDLAEFPHQIKTLRLYKEGEPLLNKHLPSMIRYAKQRNVANSIDLTTNASLMDRDLALALVDAGLDRMNISIEALDEEGYFNVSGVKIDFERFLSNLEFLYNNRGNCHIFMKISDVGLNGSKKEEFYEKFGKYCDEIAVEHISPVWPEFELNEGERITEDKDIYGMEMSNRKKQEICPYLFYSICINSDGTVSACLMDWNHKLIVGDLSTEELKDIWNGEKMQQMRKNHLLKNKDYYSACRQCGQLEYAVLDNIDDYSDDLYERCFGE